MKPTQRDLLFFLDGLKYSFKKVEYEEKKVKEIIIEIEKSFSSQPEKTNEDDIIKLISSVWNIVDTVNRLRDLVQQTPTLKQNTSEVRYFVNETKITNDLRNYIQHLRSGISKIPIPSSPVWGVLGWRNEGNPLEYFFIQTGTYQKDLIMNSAVFDRGKKEFKGAILLTVNELSVDIEELALLTNSLKTFIAGWVKNKGYRYSFESTLNPVFKINAEIGG